MFGSSAADLPPVGRQLDGARDAILRDYQRRLGDIGSPLVEDPKLWAVSREQAGYVIDDCIRSIESGKVTVNRERVAEIGELAALCAERNLRPDEPARAGAELFDAVLTVMTNAAAGRPDAADWLAELLPALHRGISSRTETVSVSSETLLLQRVEQVQTADRRRLARDIHDWLGNNISLGIRHLDLYEIVRTTSGSAADAKVAEARQVLAEVLEDARLMVSELRLRSPVVSLALALREFLRAVDPSDISIDLRIDGNEAILPTDCRDELYLVIREGLRNIFAHARAKNVVVHVDITMTEVHAVVTDDGIGFEVRGLSPANSGLVSMRERTELVGGAFELSSRPGDGTRLDIRIPLEERNHVDGI